MSTEEVDGVPAGSRAGRSLLDQWWTLRGSGVGERIPHRPSPNAASSSLSPPSLAPSISPGPKLWPATLSTRPWTNRLRRPLPPSGSFLWVMLLCCHHHSLSPLGCRDPSRPQASDHPPRRHDHPRPAHPRSQARSRSRSTRCQPRTRPPTARRRARAAQSELQAYHPPAHPGPPRRRPFTRPTKTLARIQTSHKLRAVGRMWGGC